MDSEKWGDPGTCDLEESLCMCQTGQHHKEMHHKVLVMMICDLKNFEIPAIPSRPWACCDREFSADRKNARFYVELNLLFLKFFAQPNRGAGTVKLTFHCLEDGQPKTLHS